MVEENASAGSGMLGMFNVFIDPAEAGRRAKAPWFWVWPIVVISIIFLIIGYFMMPYSMQLSEAKIAQQNLPADRLETTRKVSRIITQCIIYALPIFIMGITALMAWLVSVTGSIVSLKAKFRDIFSLMAACGLISSLQYIATYVVLRTKGDEITTQEQMAPAFGLDIFVPAHGVLLAILNFFSIFQIWYLVVLTIGLAAMAGTTKGKAFFAITPAWLIPLFFKMLGAAFGGGGASS